MPRSAPALLLLLLAAAAPAAPPHGEGARPREPGRAAQRLVDALELDERQAEAVRALLADAQAKARPVVDRLRDDLATLKAARTTCDGVTAQVRRQVRRVALDRADLLLLRMEALDELREELTPAQRKRLDELKGRRGSDEELRDDEAP
jgi:Spy/CpxP family protein refolding chaperone